MRKPLYCRKELEIRDGISIFSENDSYIENYDKIAADHLQSITATGKSQFMTSEQIQSSERVTVEVIRAFVPSSAKVLDAGIGLGELLHQLTEFDRYGVDIAITYLKHAKRTHQLHVTMAKLEELPFSDEYFDAVVACDVLEHVFRLDMVVEQLLRVLRPQGLLIVRVPNDEDLASYLTDAQPYAHSHVRNFTLESLRLYLEKCFNLRFVGHRYAGYSFNSRAQMRIQFPNLDSPLREILPDLPAGCASLFNSAAYSSLLKLVGSSAEETVDAILDLQHSFPEAYQQVAPQIVKPLEVIAVFRKV